MRKEIRHIVRDPRSLVLALVQPSLMLLLFGYALSLDVDRIPTLIYDADGTARSRELTQRFQASRFFDIRGHAGDYAAIERGIDRGTVLIGLVVPADYSKRIDAGLDAQVQILLDGSDANTATIALSYVSSLVQHYSFELRAAGQGRGSGTEAAVPLDARLRVWYNSTMESKNQVVPGLIAVIMMIIAVLLTSLTIAREWETGAMEQLLSTPLRPSELVLGKMMAYFLVAAMDVAVAMAVGVFVFDVPFRGNLALLAGAASIFLFGALCWGIFLSAVTRSQVMAYQLGIVTSFLPSMVLSGFVWAIDNMPEAIQWITRIVPARYMVTILRVIFLKGVGLEVLWVEALCLVAFATLVFLGAAYTLNRKLG
jgi:ABC-2 type transport system permease protein